LAADASVARIMTDFSVYDTFYEVLPIRAYNTFWEVLPNGVAKKHCVDSAKAVELKRRCTGLGSLGRDRPLFAFIEAGKLYLQLGDHAPMEFLPSTKVSLTRLSKTDPFPSELQISGEYPISWVYLAEWPNYKWVSLDENEWNFDFGAWLYWILTDPKRLNDIISNSLFAK